MNSKELARAELQKARMRIKKNEELLLEMRRPYRRILHMVFFGFNAAWPVGWIFLLLCGFFTVFDDTFELPSRESLIVISLTCGLWLGWLNVTQEERDAREQLSKDRAYVRAHG